MHWFQFWRKKSSLGGVCYSTNAKVQPARSVFVMENRVEALEKLASDQGKKLTELQHDIGHIKDNMSDMKQFKELIL